MNMRKGIVAGFILTGAICLGMLGYPIPDFKVLREALFLCVLSIAWLAFPFVLAAFLCNRALRKHRGRSARFLWSMTLMVMASLSLLLYYDSIYRPTGTLAVLVLYFVPIVQYGILVLHYTIVGISWVLVTVHRLEQEAAAKSN